MITEQQIRVLAAHVGDPVVSSVYLDVDGASRPVRTDVRAAFEDLARRLALGPLAQRDRTVARAVEADLQRMREWLGSGWNRSNTRGLALFSDSRRGWLEVLAVPWPVPDASGLGPRPRVAPLVGALGRNRPLLVALVDRRRLRLLAFGDGNPSELPGLSEVEPREVDTDIPLGRDHQREAAARGHYRRAAERIGAVLATAGYDRWVMGGPQEAVAALESELSRPQSATLAGRLSVRVSAGIDEISDAVRGVCATIGERLELEAVEALVELLGHGASTGLEATLSAISLRRVGTLLVADAFSAPGARCTACGHLGVSVWQCPRCGAKPVEVDDIVELAVDEAVAQHASVQFIRSGGLDDLGRIAAIDRFGSRERGAPGFDHSIVIIP